MKLVTLSVALLLAVCSIHAVGAQAPPPDRPAKEGRVNDIATLNDKKVTLSLSDATIRDALKALFTQIEVNRCIVFDTAARGLLTFTVKDVPFEGALVSILRSSRRARYAYGDTGSMLTIAPENGPVDRAILRISLGVKDVDVRYVIKSLMQSIRANYTMDQNVSGKVTLAFDYLPFDLALEKALRASKAPLTFDVDAGTYLFHPK